MKKFLLLGLMATAVTASVAARAEQPYYAGVSLGSDKYDVEIAGASSASSFERKLGGKIYGGYDYNNMIGGEVGYAYFGKPNADYTVGALRSNVEAKAQALYVAVKASTPMNEMTSLYGEIGASFNRLNLSVRNGPLRLGDDTSNKTSLYAGIGVAYNWRPDVALTLEHEYFGKFNDEGGKINYTSIGVRYKFQ